MACTPTCRYTVATPWDAYHLRYNSYFQEELGGASDVGAERLRELFAG